MIIGGVFFGLWHALAFIVFHCIPGTCAALLAYFKGYSEARGIVRAGFTLLAFFGTGMGGLVLALLLPEWPERVKPTYMRDQLGEGW